MNKKFTAKVILIALKIWIGFKFVTEGLEKFESLDRFAGRNSPFIDFYLAMGETSYLLPVLGMVEILGGVLLITQRYSFAGSLLLLPVMLNVWLAHTFLIQSPKGIALTSVWFLLLLVFVLWEKNRLSGIFKPQPLGLKPEFD